MWTSGQSAGEEVTDVFGVSIGDPMVPDVTFSYDEEHDLCFGKAFDNRAGCACIIDTMNQLYEDRERLAVNVVGRSQPRKRLVCVELP